MGFTNAAVSKLTFKVQAANVIDANTNFQWYESTLENSPKITTDRIFSQYNIVTSNPPSSIADLITFTASGGVLDGIVSNVYENAQGAPVYHELTQATPGNNTTWLAYTNPLDRSSARYWNWINPTSVPVNGIPVPYYTIQIYYLVGTTYTQLSATAAATPGGGEVGWVWNYDQGLLLLSTDAINFLKNQNNNVMPQLFARGWRYIGQVGGGGNVDDVLVDIPISTVFSGTDFPGYSFSPTTAQTGNVTFTLQPQSNTVGGGGSGTYLGLQALYTGVRAPLGQPISKIGKPGDILKINPSNDDYVWKSFETFTLTNPANPANITWYTQYKQAGITSAAGYVAVKYGENARIVLDKNIVFNIGDSTINNKISSGERCTLIIKHDTDHSFTLTAGQVNGISPFHKVIGAGPNPFNLTNTAGAVDILTGLWDSGENTMYWNIELNYGGGTAPAPTGNFAELEENLFLIELEANTGLLELEG